MGDAGWDDYQVEISACLEDTGQVRLYGRYKGWGEERESGYYFLRVRDNGSWQLIKEFCRNTGGPNSNPELKSPYKEFFTVMDEGKPGSLPIKVGEWFRIGLVFRGGRIVTSFNGKQISNFVDTNASRKGMIGLGTGWGKVSFADLKILPPAVKN
jgi:hypothetical protein